MSLTHCTDCQTALEPITIIDNTDSGPADLQYRAVDARKGMWGLGGYPIRGKVLSFLCSKCGRIFLYASERANAGRVSIADTKDPQGGLSEPDL